MLRRWEVPWGKSQNRMTSSEGLRSGLSEEVTFPWRAEWSSDGSNPPAREAVRAQQAARCVGLTFSWTWLETSGKRQNLPWVTSGLG